MESWPWYTRLGASRLVDSMLFLALGPAGLGRKRLATATGVSIDARR
jgi:hypothetical protein